jgi:hypothetical protein
MRDVALTFGLMGAVFLALVAQEFLPVLWALEGARVVLPPMIFCYGALTLPFPLMLALAVWTGLTNDLMYMRVVSGLVEIPLGWSILFYVALGSICQGLRPLVLRGHWELHAVMSAFGTASLLAAQFTMITIRRLEDGFVFNERVLWRMLVPAMLALMLAPLFYLLVQLGMGRWRPGRRAWRGF